jgi:hypothetical protein
LEAASWRSRSRHQPGTPASKVTPASVAEKDTELQTSTSGAGARQGGGKLPKDLNTVQGTEEQLQGVSGAQQAGRKGKGPVIDNVNKSEQDAATARKKIQDLKDAQGHQ